jgi:hypothetical protein
MTETDLEIFRIRFRQALLERLIIKTAFLASHVQGILSVAGTREGLSGWLDANSEEALHVYGEALKDPALTALFSDEAKEITEAMKRNVDKIALEAQKAFGP